MRMTFKTLLLCLLLTLLPLQGFANALVPTCAQSHQLAMTVQHSAHCHDGTTKQHQNTHSDCCNGCGACCNGIAALPVAVDFSLPADAYRPYAISSDPQFSAHTPAVPERPPRLLTT